ncbi:MAG: glutamyl-tRNA reductase [Chloroflexi bacterium]|nr:glutamyl-tRNA reductase [Chloroflexota bacterium]
MHIIAIGLNHNSAPLRLRERLAFIEEQVRASLARLNCGRIPSSFTEMIIVSTCNRVELYAVSNELAFAELEAFLSDIHNIPAGELRPHLYQFVGMQAARHLFEVAAGLDSLVIGEPQILGQITRSLELARGQGTAGSTLNRLFQAAIHAGKRARTETAISRNPASVSSLAASLSERAVHNISEAQIVILGAGEMAELAVEALRKRGANHVIVVNRTLERAHSLAQRWNARADTFENLHAALSSADIVVSSTSAPHIIVTKDMVHQAMQTRPQRPLVLIDIAVPRDIDPGAAHIPHVKLFDIDTLNAQLEDSLARRMDEVPHVKAVLEKELVEFGVFLKSLEMLPLIADIRQQAETIRLAELEKTLRRMPGLTDADRKHIESMTRALVKKLLHAPTHHLRAEATSSRAPEYAAVARTLFDLTDKQTHPTSVAAD